MVRLEHINLVVKEIDLTLYFIQTAFPEWKIRGRGETRWYGRKRNWLHVGTDDYYITLNDGAEGENRDLKRVTPGLAHIGFCVDDVELISARLQDKGFKITTIGADHPYRKSVYFSEPAGFEFEFIQYLSEKSSEKNQYGGETSEIIRVGCTPSNNN